MDSCYRCEIADRFVNVWPAVTGESGFYDVVYGTTDDDAVTLDRLTAFEAASVVVTELGVPHATTIDQLAGMITRWREEFDSQGREPVRSCSECSGVGYFEDEGGRFPCDLCGGAGS